MVEELVLVRHDDAQVLLVLEDLKDLIQRRRLKDRDPSKWRLRLGQRLGCNQFVVLLVEMELWS